MDAIEVRDISKKYGSRSVVEKVSFILNEHQILGLIGPNGAGKTTSIRMIMDVIKPDSGEVRLFGAPFNNELKNRIGYLPEERGLYRKKTIFESMLYLAALKGLDPARAAEKAAQWLERVNMQTHRNKKIEELSHGMAQIIQLGVTLLHDPAVIILDEPFNGLDPVNVQMVKEIILDLKKQGRAVILSTHRMNEVEELCDRVYMIDKGRGVLYGSLAEIKARYRRAAVSLEFEGELPDLPDMQVTRLNSHKAEISFSSAYSHQQVLQELVSRGVKIIRFEIATPTLNDIFLQVAGGRA